MEASPPNGWFGGGSARHRWTCLLHRNRPIANCGTPWPRLPSARMHWHTAGPGAYSSMHSQQWASLHRHRPLTGPTGPGSQSSCSWHQFLPGEFPWGGTSFLRGRAQFSICTRISGTFMFGSWTWPGGTQTFHQQWWVPSLRPEIRERGLPYVTEMFFLVYWLPFVQPQFHYQYHD